MYGLAWAFYHQGHQVELKSQWGYILGPLQLWESGSLLPQSLREDG